MMAKRLRHPPESVKTVCSSSGKVPMLRALAIRLPCSWGSRPSSVSVSCSTCSIL